jgi:hypothetical protein
LKSLVGSLVRGIGIRLPFMAKVAWITGVIEMTELFRGYFELKSFK